MPSYYDEQLRVDHEINSSWNVSLSSIGTTDVLELYTTKDEDAGAKHLYTRTRFLRLTAAAKYHEGPWTANLTSRRAFGWSDAVPVVMARPG